MKRPLFLFFLLLVLHTGYSQNYSNSLETASFIKRLYSSNVNDTFSVFIKLPKQYKTENRRNFTTIYLLDGNMYFDIVVDIVAKYNEIGIMPPVIVVGIGYKNFDEMERLRSRDLLYPKAPAKEEIENSGGGKNFLAFIKAELIPFVDNSYRTKQENRILIGHSLEDISVYMLYWKT